MPAARKSVVKNIRVHESTLDLIERAASLTGDNFTHYVLAAAQAKAQLELMDRNAFIVPPEEFDRVDAALALSWPATDALMRLRKDGRAHRNKTAEAAE